MNNTELKEKIEQLEKELAELKNAVKDNDEPKFERVEEGKLYYYITLFDTLVIGSAKDEDVPYDNKIFINNNYFHTIERANEVAEKIKMLLKLERLHDIYCNDYVPDFNNTDSDRYCAYYDVEEKAWKNACCTFSANPVDVYFPTKEIAKKVCDILNSKEDKNE